MSLIICGKECANVPMDLETLIKSCIYEYNGCFYLNANFVAITEENCDELTPAITCGETLSFDQLINQLFGVDSCGHPCINIIGMGIETERAQ